MDRRKLNYLFLLLVIISVARTYTYHKKVEFKDELYNDLKLYYEDRLKDYKKLQIEFDYLYKRNSELKTNLANAYDKIEELTEELDSIYEQND